MRISIIIPCYNEIRTIDKILDKVIAQSKFEKEIIVVDDFSLDGTREYLQNKGKSKIDKLILNEKKLWKRIFIKKGN